MKQCSRRTWAGTTSSETQSAGTTALADELAGAGGTPLRLTQRHPGSVWMPCDGSVASSRSTSEGACRNARAWLDRSLITRPVTGLPARATGTRRFPTPGSEDARDDEAEKTPDHRRGRHPQGHPPCRRGLDERPPARRCGVPGHHGRSRRPGAVDALVRKTERRRSGGNRLLWRWSGPPPTRREGPGHRGQSPRPAAAPDQG